MKLGEMLIRDGRLEARDLERVIAQQSKEGGRLGSLLVADGLIDVETLTAYLGLELGIPIATMETFERCKRSAVSLLTPEQARHFHCIPLVIQGQTLIVAVDTPHDMQKLEDIGKATGYLVLPRVAPEICIHIYLERLYGIAQPEHFADLKVGALGAGEKKELPAAPLPGLPPEVEEPTSPPFPAPSLEKAAQPNEELDADDALELDADDLIEDLEEDTQPEEEDEAALPERPEALSHADAVTLISETDKRSDIADAMLAHASELFEVATLLLVRDNMAFGWKGFGPDIDIDRIETLLIPLDATSIFKVALGDERNYRAKAFSSSLHSHFFRILRTPVPDYSIVVICTIGKRIVNLLYGHTEGGKDLSDDQMDGLANVMNTAAQAYMRLISNSKLEDQEEKKKRRKKRKSKRSITINADE